MNTYYGVIYKITNKTNNKIYIGQTTQKNPINRFYSHITESKKSNNNTYLYNAISKYGKENFAFEIIDTAISKEELNEKEKLYINTYNTLDQSIGYNIRKGGQFNTMTPEVAKRISEGKLKNIAIKGSPKFLHPNKKHIDFVEFEKLIIQNPKIKHKELAKYFNINKDVLSKKIKEHYNLNIIQTRAKILNIEINEAKLTYKNVDIEEFLNLIKKGYKQYEIAFMFKQDIRSLTRKWKRWYPKYNYEYLQKNIDILIRDYNTNGKPLGNYT